MSPLRSRDGSALAGTWPVAALVVLLAAGCSGRGDQPTSAPLGAATASSVGPPPTPPQATPGATAEASTAAPRPSATAAVRTAPPLVRPSTGAGPLQPSSLPAVSALLGTGWRPFADPGSSEDGYLGNGTPWLARDPVEVAATALPLGCQSRHPVPTPRFALETDGTDAAGHRAVLIRTRFATPAQAVAFVDRTAADARACARQPGETGPAGTSAPVTVVRAVAGVVVSDRVDVFADPAAGARWSEFKAAGGTDVLLLAVDQRLDGPHRWSETAVAAALGHAVTSSS
ncbi:MAG: hypothetical protein ACTHOD_04940 [Motilibacteraceae bacterium]